NADNLLMCFFIYFRIQELAFTLCHVYVKATHSVSIRAPVYCEFSLVFMLKFNLIRLIVSRCRRKSLLLVYHGSFLIILQLVCSQGVFHMSPEAHGLQFDDSASSSSSTQLSFLHSRRIFFSISSIDSIHLFSPFFLSSFSPLQLIF